MHFPRALAASVGIYLATFVFGGLLSVALGIEIPEDPSTVPMEMWIISACTAVVLMIAGSWWFFRSPTVAPSWQSGLFLGIVAVVTGFILDTVMLLLAGLQQDVVDALLSYYTQPVFLFTLLFVIIIPAVFGWGKKNRKR